MDPQRYLSPVPVRVVRKIPSDGPVMDITSPDIACNKGGEDGTSDVFDVNAGSDMTFKWTNVRPYAPIPFRTVWLTFVTIVACGSPGSCHDFYGFLQWGLFQFPGFQW